MSPGANPTHGRQSAADAPLPASAPPAPTTRAVAAVALLILVGLLLRGFALTRTPAVDPAYHGATAQTYIEVATAFLDGHGWTWNGRPATQHPPGYSLYLAACLSLTRAHGVTLARAGQALVDALAIGLVWAVARRAASGPVALAVAAVFAVAPEFVLSPTPVLADAMMTAWMALAVYGALRWNETGRWPWAACMAAGCALAMLWRSECLLLAPAALLWGVCGAPHRHASLRGGFTVLVLLLVAYGPWAWWSRVATREGTAASSGWANTVLSGLAQRPNRFGLLSSDRYTGAIAHARGLEWHSPEAAAHFTAVAGRVVARDPALPLLSVATREWKILTDVNVPWGASHLGRIASRAVLTAAAALGLYALTAGRIRWRPAAVLSAPLLLYMGTLGLLWYEPRFVVPGHLSHLWLAGAAGSAGVAPRRRWLAGLVLVLGGIAIGVGVWRRHADLRLSAQLHRARDGAPWQPAAPQSIVGAQVRHTDGVVEISGPHGASAAPGFIVLWPDVPTVDGAVATVLADVQVLHGSVKVGLLQTVAFPAQPPEHLWLAQVRLARPGRYAVVLPVENLIGSPIQLAVLPAPAAGATAAEAEVRCRLWKVSGWPIEPGPSQPRVLPLTRSAP